MTELVKKHIRPFTQCNYFQAFRIFMYLLTILILIYFTQQKQALHIDEVLTFGLANNAQETFNIPNYGRLSHTYFQAYFMPLGEGTAFSLKNVWLNQVLDVHPPFYYILINFLSSLQGRFTPWIGWSINLVCHLLSSYMIERIMQQFTKRPGLSLASAIFWAWSIGAISSFVFIRMYSLLTLLHLLYFAQLEQIYQLPSTNSWAPAYQQEFAKMFLIIWLGCLTHYYFYIFAALASLLYFLGIARQKACTKLIHYTLTGLAAVTTAIAVFPWIFSHIFASNRGQEVQMNVMNLDVIDAMSDNLNFLQEDLFGGQGMLVIVLLLLGLSLLSFHWRQWQLRQLRPLLLTACLALTYFILIQWISNYLTHRYIFAIYPFLIISLVLLANYVLSLTLTKGRFERYGLSGLLLLAAIFQLNGEVDYLYGQSHYPGETITQAEETKAIFLHEHDWELTDYYDDLQDFQEVFVWQHFNDNSLPLPDFTNYIAGENIVLYLPNSTLRKERLQEFRQTYHFKDYQFIPTDINKKYQAYYFTK